MGQPAMKRPALRIMDRREITKALLNEIGNYEKEYGKFPPTLVIEDAFVNGWDKVDNPKFNMSQDLSHVASVILTEAMNNYEEAKVAGKRNSSVGKSKKTTLRKEKK